MVANPTEPFRLQLIDTFAISRRGTVLVGHAEVGRVGTGDVLDLVHAGHAVRVCCIGVEMLHPISPSDGPPPIGVLVRGVRPFEVTAGDELTAARAG